jgi:hypothetical protein
MSWSRFRPKRPEDDGKELLTAAAMKRCNLWDITPWSPLEANRRFGGTRRVHVEK